ncbi:MAG: hypothetical protein OXP09_04420 [Gammaproteobacteria bacterium]|nr:hypothetical protein [Gammaproteobacteria bacterium]
MRRNIVAHGAPLDSDYFLLVTPDRLYLWQDAGSDPAELPPTFVADTEPAFAPYFKNAGIDARKISGEAFEFLVAAWLSDLTRLPEADAKSASGPAWLEESGFRAAVQDGRIEYEDTP